MNIITSKTKRTQREQYIPVNEKAFHKQYHGMSESSKPEYLREKRIGELARAGYNIDAISGMMDGVKGGPNKGEIRKVVNRVKNGKIKLNGEI